MTTLRSFFRWLRDVWANKCPICGSPMEPAMVHVSKHGTMSEGWICKGCGREWL